jgi:hypothetical protein
VFCVCLVCFGGWWCGCVVCSLCCGIFWFGCFCGVWWCRVGGVWVFGVCGVGLCGWRFCGMVCGWVCVLVDEGFDVVSYGEVVLWVICVVWL